MVNNHLYFGCLNQKGHHLFNQFGRNVGYLVGGEKLPFTWKQLDCGFIANNCKWVDGHTTLTVTQSGYTIIAFPDTSIDNRSSSNSAFIVNEILPFDKMVELFSEKFPDIFKRFNFKIIDKTEYSHNDK